MAKDPSMMDVVVLTAATLAALAFVGVMLASPFVDPERAEVHYWGARILPPGPASDGLPIIPVRIGPGFELRGEPTHLSWYAYSGREGAPGLKPDSELNNTFHYRIHPERLRSAHMQGLEPWWEPLLGQPMRMSDFPGEWTAAPAIWRSIPTDAGPTELHAWVMRVDNAQHPHEVRLEFAPDGFLAFAAHDTFLGCEVAWQLSNNPTFVRDGRPLLADSCHDSRYDPQDIRRYPMPPGEERDG